MPVVRYVKGARSSSDSTPTPEPTLTALDVLSLAVAKRQLRITTADADDIVTDAIESAVAFIADASDSTLAEVRDSQSLSTAAILALRSFYNGFETLPPTWTGWALIDAGACR